MKKPSGDVVSKDAVAECTNQVKNTHTKKTKQNKKVTKPSGDFVSKDAVAERAEPSKRGLSDRARAYFYVSCVFF